MKTKFQVPSSKFQKGLGLIEVLLVSALVTAVFGAFLQASTLSLRLLHREKENLEAVFLAGEALEAVRAIRDESWDQNIAPLTNQTPYYPIIENGKWRLSAQNPGTINNRYARSLVFDQVFRDAEDRIALAGTYDPDTRKVTSRITWEGKDTELVAYITNFHTGLGNPAEGQAVAYEGASTDADLANFPSDNAGNGDPTQSFTTASQSLLATRIDLLLRRTTPYPSDVFAELRSGPTGTILGTSQVIVSSTISDAAPAWVAFRFQNAVALAPSTSYDIRLRSAPSSTDALSGSAGRLHWLYTQSPSSPYNGGDARRYVGRLSNPDDTGQQLNQYDFGFRVYALQ
ncbi:MAG: hypothetical protein HY472_01180 [Candidatus Sungbacteria bacterium]|nr:hypothetical protein [Candidatus Sungbacteria bacterium]